MAKAAAADKKESQKPPYERRDAPFDYYERETPTMDALEKWELWDLWDL